VDAKVLLDCGVQIWGTLTLSVPIPLLGTFSITFVVAPITIFKSLKEVLPDMTWPYPVIAYTCKNLAAGAPVSKRQVSPSWPSTLRVFNATGGASVAVAFAAGALTALTELTASAIPSFAFESAAVFSAATANYSAVGKGVLLLPHGTTFLKPVGVTLQLPADVAALVGTLVSCGTPAAGGNQSAAAAGANQSAAAGAANQSTARRGLVILRKRDDAAATPWEEMPPTGLTCDPVGARERQREGRRGRRGVGRGGREGGGCGGRETPPVGRGLMRLGRSRG
jgi:hypothetical protein